MSAHAARAHAKLSPSASHRWMACPGSVRASEGVPNKSSAFADEGTAAHTLAEHCLRTGSYATTWLGMVVDIRDGKLYDEDAIEPGPSVFLIDEGMVDAVQLYVDTVNGYVGPGDEVEYEAKLDLRHIPGMEFGTGDCVVFKPEQQHLVILDLKYGRGVKVEAVDNPQTRLYAIGAARRFHNRGLKTVEMVIVQPRCPHPQGPVRKEILDAVELVEFRREIEQAAAATLAPDAVLVAGEHCRFCPAHPTCKEARRAALAVADMEFGDPPVVAEMSGEEMAVVVRQAGQLRDWVNAVEARAHDVVKHGGSIPGLKLVASRATRRWRDEEEAKQYLLSIVEVPEDEIYAEPKMRSPAQIEKVIGRKRKDEIADLIVSASSGTILVPDDDPRPPVKVGVDEEFANA